MFKPSRIRASAIRYSEYNPPHRKLRCFQGTVLICNFLSFGGPSFSSDISGSVLLWALAPETSGVKTPDSIHFFRRGLSPTSELITPKQIRQFRTMLIPAAT